MSAPLFDRDLYIKRWHLHKPLSNTLDTLLDHMASTLMARLTLFKNPFQKICIHSPKPLPNLVDYLLKREQNVNVVSLNNLDEKISFTHAFDLIISVNQWHWVNDLPAMLQSYQDALQPGGLLLSTFVGENSLYELRHALNQADIQCHSGVSPRVSPFITIQSIASLLQQARLKDIVTDYDSLTLHYSSVMKLIHDVRSCYGRNALYKRSKRPLSKKFLETVQAVYPQEKKGGIQATLDLVYISAWKGL